VCHGHAPNNEANGQRGDVVGRDAVTINLLIPSCALALAFVRDGGECHGL
jgi:hypothetical protein